MTPREMSIAGCVVVAIAGIGIWVLGSESPGPAPVVRQVPMFERPTATAVAPLEREVKPHVVATARTASKASEFNDLLKSGAPADRFQAYTLAQACVWAYQAQRTAEMTVPAERDAATTAELERGGFAAKTQAACGDLTDQQLLTRVKYLEEAAEAGVPMAAVRLADEGPFGDPSALMTRADDPAVLEWRKHIGDLIKLAAEKGDYIAMLSLSNMYATGSGVLGVRDPMKALEYATAMWELQKKATGRISEFAEQSTKKLSEGLDAEQVERAKRAGHLLAMGGEK